MKFFKRLSALSMILVFLMSFVVVPSFAAGVTESELFVQALDVYNSEEGQSFFDRMASSVIFNCTTSEAVSYDTLENCRSYYIRGFSSLLAQGHQNGWGSFLYDALFGIDHEVVLRKDSNRDIVRMFDDTLNAWVVDSYGNFPWCTLSEYNAHVGPDSQISGPYNVSSPASNNVNQWLNFKDVVWSNAVVVTEQSLSDSVTSFNALGDTCSLSRTTIGSAATPVKYIYKTGGSYGKVFCNYRGWPYIAYVEKDTTVTNQTFNYDSGNTYNGDVVYDQGTIDKSTLVNQAPITWDESQNFFQTINNENGIFTFVDADGEVQQQYIESLTYNSDNRSYTVNTYDTTYNITNNYYEFNYYTYNIQYTYNNTYVTYIGSTAEFVPTVYEYYYQLPDGRSSADLTDEDIAGLSFQFHDVLNYKKSATDTTLRALYHFDGNTNDSSFWSGQGSFAWNTGASITYMESNAFNGCLYLDEKAHQFIITLPSFIGSGDFTLQWRYYQNSANTSNNIDNTVSVGGQTLLKWSEQYLYDGSDTQIAGLSVGTWQELALIRNAGTLYMYHNGICVASAASTTVFNSSIAFYLGGNSRAYSMFDELRFLNFAFVEGGSSYTPTAVPFDTNSILVLPDGATPVAEEHWEHGSDISPFLHYDFSDFTNLSYSTLTYTATPPSSSTAYYCDYWSSGSYRTSVTDRTLHIIPDTSLSFYEGFSHLSASGLSYRWLTARGSTDSYLHLYLNGALWAGFANSSTYSLLGTYTFTACFNDGSVVSRTITDPCPVGTKGYYGYYCAGPVVDLSSGSNVLKLRFLHFDLLNNNTYKSVNPAILAFWGDCDLVDFEIVEGDTSNTHEFVSAVYSSDELQPNTAAIQSDIPVNGYTVGGVRPTFPQRGDVWFPVEGNRISGVYIYNGQAWEVTNARWWTGSRWIPIYAFDIVTLADLWDVVSGESGEPVTPAITSDYSFWNWWKNAWNNFTSTLWDKLGSGSGGGGSGSGSGGGSSGNGFFATILEGLANGLKTLIEGIFSVITEILEKLLGVLTDLLSSLFSFVTETVLGGISEFFSSFADGSLFSPFDIETVDNGDGTSTSTATLPEGIAGVFALFSGIFQALPSEIIGILIFGIAALALISVLKFVYS